MNNSLSNGNDFTTPSPLQCTKMILKYYFQTTFPNDQNSIKISLKIKLMFRNDLYSFWREIGMRCFLKNGSILVPLVWLNRCDEIRVPACEEFAQLVTKLPNVNVEIL